MAIQYMNDAKLGLSRQGKSGAGVVCEHFDGDYIANAETSGWLVYHKDAGSGGGEAYTKTVYSWHDHTMTNTIFNIDFEKERVETVLKAKVFTDGSSLNAHTNKLIDIRTTAGAASLGCGVNVNQTVGGVIALQLKGANFTLGSITISANTEYIIHHVYDDENGYHMVEVFDTSFNLVGRKVSTAIGAGTFAAADDVHIGASKVTNNTAVQVTHQLKDIYIFDQNTDHGKSWFGPDYTVVADQSMTDGATTTFTTSSGSDNAALIDEWPKVSTDFNHSNTGDTSDVEDIFALVNYAGSKTVKAVAVWTVSKATNPSGFHDHFIDDGSNRLRGTLYWAGEGSSFSANEGVCFSTNPAGGVWTNSEYDGLEAGYDRVSVDDSGRHREFATMIVFYIEANAYGAGSPTTRSRDVNVSP